MKNKGSEFIQERDSTFGSSSMSSWLLDLASYLPIDSTHHCRVLFFFFFLVMYFSTSGVTTLFRKAHVISINSEVFHHWISLIIPVLSWFCLQESWGKDLYSVVCFCTFLHLLLHPRIKLPTPSRNKLLLKIQSKQFFSKLIIVTVYMSHLRSNQILYDFTLYRYLIMLLFYK
jgi:hypothetical protein